MRGAVLHAPGDVRVEDRDDPTIVEPTDAVIRLAATCVCGSDLWHRQECLCHPQPFLGRNRATLPRSVAHRTPR
jgi:threonine dehydrogenase-like Zn-dependent dehydrogenase